MYKKTPPPEAIIEAANKIDQFVGLFYSEIAGGKINRRFEYTTCAYISIIQITHLISSVTTLARADFNNIQGANILSRAVIESAFKSRWLLEPIDPFQREGRWIQFLDESVKHFKNHAENRHLPKTTREHYKIRRKQAAEFSRKLEELLTKEQIFCGETLPSMNQIMKEIKYPESYHYYSELSAHVHSNMTVNEYFCQNYGTAKIFGNFIDPAHWILPLSACVGSFYLIGSRFLEDNDFLEPEKFTFDQYQKCISIINKISE